MNTQTKLPIDTLGLIAGNGRFPLFFAKMAKDRGIKIVAVAIKGDTSRLLAGLVDKLFWIRAGQPVQIP